MNKPDNMENSTESSAVQETSTTSETRVSAEISDQLRDVLMIFTATFLVEEPEDIINFAVDFFKKLQTSRRSAVSRASIIKESASQEFQNDSNHILSLRRESVYAESFDPTHEDGEETRVVHPKSDAQRLRLANAVKGVLLFRSLQPEQLSKVMDAMFEKRVTKGDYIIKQGEDGDNFYVVELGIFKVIKDSEHIHTYTHNGVFGELALMYNQPRAASILAETDGLLWALDRNSFRHIVLKSAHLQWKTYENLINSVPMLQVLQEYERMTLADALVSKRYTNGETICKQGDSADGMYFIEDGTVRITIGHASSEIEVTKLERGQYFGELSLVTNRPRAASAYAFGNVKLAFLDKDAFVRILGFLADIMKGNAELYEKKWKIILQSN